MADYIDDDLYAAIEELREKHKGTIVDDLWLASDRDVEKMKGIKHDQDKLKPRLIFEGMSKALEEVIRVGTFGANKYTENGWQTVDNGVNRYTDAMYRHLNKYAQGEEYDDESGLCHLSHAAWNILAIIQLLHND